MENKEKNVLVEKITKYELQEGQKLYPAVYLGQEHLSGTSKEGKKYDLGKVQFQLILEQTNKDTGEITIKKPIVDAMCEPTSLPENFEDYEKCFALYEMPADPSYEKAKPRFVKLIKKI